MKWHKVSGLAGATYFSEDGQWTILTLKPGQHRLSRKQQPIGVRSTRHTWSPSYVPARCSTKASCSNAPSTSPRPHRPNPAKPKSPESPPLAARRRWGPTGLRPEPSAHRDRQRHQPARRPRRRRGRRCRPRPRRRQRDRRPDHHRRLAHLASRPNGTTPRLSLGR